MEPVVARKTWRTVEPLHGSIYFAPEAVEEYAGLGLTGMSGYFASRSAAMGAVGAAVVTATFFNFDPTLVADAVATAWSVATPAAVLAARDRAADRLLRRVLGDAVHGDDMAEAARLLRRAADAAASNPEGRPLFAAHAALPWPEEPHLVLWHAQTRLREFRGDGHIAALVVEGVGGCEALVVHAATGEIPGGVLQSTRGWADDTWQAAVDACRSRGWIGPDGSFTDAGRASRQRVEDLTDRLALGPYQAIGDDACGRIRELCRPWSKAMVAAQASPFGSGNDR